MYRYLRTVLAKPQIPEKFSVEGALKNGYDHANVPGLCNVIENEDEERESSSFLEELAKDLQYIGRTYQRLHDKISRIWKIPDEVMEAGTSSHNPRRSPSPGASVTTAASPATRDRFRVPPETPIPNLDGAPASPEGVNPSLGGTPPPEDAVSSRRTSAHTLPEISTYQLHTFHRLTALSDYPADSLATHLSWNITNMLFLPLETLFIRSLALSFLSSPAANAGAQAAAARWRGEVFPLGSWFGMGLRSGWRGIGDYVGKMVLLSGLEIGFVMVVWQPCTCVCRLVGQKWFGWGKL